MARMIRKKAKIGEVIRLAALMKELDRNLMFVSEYGSTVTLLAADELVAIHRRFRHVRNVIESELGIDVSDGGAKAVSGQPRRA